MGNIELNVISLLEVYGKSLKELKLWIKDFRICNHNNQKFIKETLVDRFQRDDKDIEGKGRLIRINEQDIMHLNIIDQHIQLTKDQQTPEWKFIAFTVFRALLLFDALFSYLISVDEEESYPAFYKNQYSFICTYLKIKMFDIIYMKQEYNLEYLVYGIVFFIDDKDHKVFTARFLNKPEEKRLNIFSKLAFNHKAALAIESSKTNLVSYEIH